MIVVKVYRSDKFDAVGYKYNGNIYGCADSDSDEATAESIVNKPWRYRTCNEESFQWKYAGKFYLIQEETE